MRQTEITPRNLLQILFLILSEFKQIEYFLLLLKSTEKFSDNLREKRSYLTHYSPVLLIYTPWKHLKTFRFSYILKGVSISNTGLHWVNFLSIRSEIWRQSLRIKNKIHILDVSLNVLKISNGAPQQPRRRRRCGTSIWNTFTTASSI